MPKAYSYLRFSTPEQARGDSFRRQTEKARGYALRNGLELDTKLNLLDAGVSAFQGANATSGALAGFLRAVDDGDVEVGSILIVESLDRISRDTVRRAVRTLENIVERGVSVVDLSDGERVYSTETLDSDPFAFVMMALRFIRSHEESSLKSARLKSAWQNKRASAAEKPLTARAPTWLTLTPDRKWQVRQDRAAIVRRIYEMAAVGTGEHKIASTLNGEGISPFGNGVRVGQHWHRTSIIKILESPAVGGTLVPYTHERVAGRTVRHRQDPIEGYFPTIVDDVLRTSVIALRTGTRSPLRGRHSSAKIQNIFGGLARCPICSSTMTRVTKGSRSKAGSPSLICTKAKAGAGCRYRPVRLHMLEDALREHRHWLASTGPSGGHEETYASAISALRADIQQQDFKISRLVDAIATGLDSWSVRKNLSDLEFDAARMRLEERRLISLQELSDRVGVQRRLADLEEALSEESTDLERINVLLRQLFLQVIPQYGTGILEITWKEGGKSAIKFADSDDPSKAPPEWQEVARDLVSQYPLPNYAMTREVYDQVNPPAVMAAIEEHVDRLRREWDQTASEQGRPG